MLKKKTKEPPHVWRKKKNRPPLPLGSHADPQKQLEHLKNNQSAKIEKRANWRGERHAQRIKKIGTVKATQNERGSGRLPQGGWGISI